MRISTFLSSANVYCVLMIMACTFNAEAISLNTKLNTASTSAITPSVSANDTTGINPVILFHSRCTQCHQPFKDSVGPALRGLETRGPWSNPENIRAWVNNPAAFMSKNQYVKDLKAKFGILMMGFPDISLEMITAITKYVNEVSPEEFEKNDSLYHPRPK
jgi:hypothetical protein